MLAKPLRTKRKSASAERGVRPLGATIDMATPDIRTSNCSSERGIFALMFTKRQPGFAGVTGFCHSPGIAATVGTPDVVQDLVLEVRGDSIPEDLGCRGE